MRLLIAIWLAVRCCAASALELVIATDEYPPYISADPRQSFITELYTEIGKQMGVTFRFRFAPWKRCLAELDAGRVWAVVPFVPTPERQRRYLLSSTLYTRKAKFFYHEHGGREWLPGYKDLLELTPFRIGGVAGYWYEAMFRQAGIPLDLAVNDLSNFRKLEVGRFELAIVDENVGNYLAHTYFGPHANQFHSLDSPYYLSENVMMVNPGAPNAALLARFNRALDAVRKRGVYDQIVNRRRLVLLPSAATAP